MKSRVLLWLSLIKTIIIFIIPTSNCTRFNQVGRKGARAKIFELEAGFNGRAAFLADKDDIYIKTILRRSIESTKEALRDGLSLLEIEFPPIRANDPTSAGTFDASAAFVREYIKADILASLGKELFVVFPERSERQIAEKRWGATTCTLTSIDSILTNDMSQTQIQPKVMVVVAPGFNIPEYIDIAKFERIWEECPTIIIVNGYLSRVRAGFFPALLYPGLAKVKRGLLLSLHKYPDA